MDKPLSNHAVPNDTPLNDRPLSGRSLSGRSAADPAVTPQDAPAIAIRGVITYDRLMGEIAARNPIIANRQR